MRPVFLLVLLAACASDVDVPDGDMDDDLVEADDPVDTVDAARRATFDGVNGHYCIESAFNCRFRQPGISQRVTTRNGLEHWAVEPGASLRDGNGDVLAVSTLTKMTFNYGQTRSLAGKAHALAMSSNNNSAGWYPLDRITAEDSFRDRVGEVNAQDPHDGRMACYEIRDSHDTAKELRKVVFDSEATHERAGDYMSLVRGNNRRSANLIFMVPGFGLGGAAIDHFPAGTKFRRVRVPTTTGKPSITIPLWSQDAQGRYRKRDGSMRFLYGYVVGNGDKRFGWIAQDALAVSTGCR